MAKELGAIFQKTSAKESTGIEDLFIKIGLKLLTPSNDQGDSGGNTGKKEIKDNKERVKLEKNDKIEKKKKKGCC